MVDRRRSIRLTEDERHLVRTALELLLASERDAESIAQLKVLLDRLRTIETAAAAA